MGRSQPYEGVTSTPVIDPAPARSTWFRRRQSSSGSTFRLNALDVTTGAQKFGGPVTINASVAATNSAAVNGVQTLNTSCIQRAALLLANGNVYIGFGGCHTRMAACLQRLNAEPGGRLQRQPQPERRRHVCQRRRCVDGRRWSGGRQQRQCLYHHRQRSVGWTDGVRAIRC